MTGRHRAVQGRHRKPEPPRSGAARASLAGVAVAAPLGLELLTGGSAAAAPAVPAAPPGVVRPAAVARAAAGPALGPAAGWGAIVHCESGGNPRASNGTHFGLFQFDLPTWRSVGGTVHPLNATPAEQLRRANLLFAARGTQPWAASQSCWRGVSRPLLIRGGVTTGRATVRPKLTAAPTPRPRLAPKPAPKPAPRATSRRLDPPPAPRLHSHRVIRGDTLSAVAVHNHVAQRAIHGFRSGNPNLIYPGEQLTWRK